MSEPNELEQLIKILSKLPGLGPRSARRAVLHMVQKRQLVLAPLTKALTQVHDNAKECLHCANISTLDICPICSAEKRQNGQICVVETAADLWALERAHAFEGRYHVLGGLLNALDSTGPDDIKIPKLLQRIQTEDISEVILALSATIDGQTTAHYIAEQLPNAVKVTSLAQGIPIGGELDYLDDGTLYAALSARKELLD